MKFCLDGVLPAGYMQEIDTENSYVKVRGQVCVNNKEHDLEHAFKLRDPLDYNGPTYVG